MNHQGATNIQLPNLPGVRKGPLEVPPKIYSKSRPRGQDHNNQNKQQEDRSQAELTAERIEEIVKTNSAYPIPATSFNDVFGRYSLKAKEADRLNKTLALPYTNLDSAPYFVVNSKGKVLHFLAYFFETVPLNLLEPFRYRLVEIVHFIEDNSFEISEPIIKNSGLAQGKILRRGPIMNAAANRHFIAQDFLAGKEVVIYGRTYTVIKCDQETSRYLASLGVQFGEPCKFPGDVQAANKLGQQRGQEVGSGTDKNAIQKRLLPGDEAKQLKFIARWEDIDAQLTYTVGDNTMSMYEIQQKLHSGKNPPVHVLLKKAKVRKEVLDGNEDESTVLITTAEEVGIPTSPFPRYFLHWIDLKIGSVLPMSGMTIQILDADSATRDFYKAHNGELGPRVIIEKVEVSKPTRLLPPHTGFGSYEDSLTSCQGSLVPHPAKKDLHKLKQYAGLQLQFRATFQDPDLRAGEKLREFVLIYFMEDDGIQILELPGEKNSGYQPGTFLSKVKFFKDDGHLQFQPEDFYAGRTVTINGYIFTITNAAEKTLEFMESRSDIWASTNIDQIVIKLVDYADDVKLAVENNTECNNGVVDAITVHRYMEEAQAPLVLQEAITLLRYLSRTLATKKDKTAPSSDTTASVSQSIRLSQLVEFLDSLTRY